MVADKLTDLEALISHESEKYRVLQCCIESCPDASDLIQQASLDHDKVVSTICESAPENHSELITKCKFIFSLLKRDFDNDEYFQNLEEILTSDIRAVETPSN